MDAARRTDEPLPEDPYAGRRQFDELLPSDLVATGAWWFPGGDGRLSGPDAGTVMPLDTSVAGEDGAIVFPEGQYLLRATFTLADGSRVPGHVTYAPGDRGSLRDREPTLVTEGGQVPLWRGLLVPGDDEIHAALRLLGRPRAAVFPLRWSADFHPPEDTLSGALDGFAVDDRHGERCV